MICLSNLRICLLILLTIFDISFMETFSEDTCGTDNDMFRWFEQMGNFAERYQVNTDHITETHAKIHLLEHKMDQTQKRLEENQQILLEMQKILVEQHQQHQQHIEENQRSLLEIQKIVQRTHNNLQNYIKNPTDIVIQRRMDGSEDFYRTWDEYKHGFGDSNFEFFIGLEKLYNLTNSDRYELIITMEDFENNKRYAKYDHFVIGSEAEKYFLKSLGNYTGTAGNSLATNLKKTFSTKDQDNDEWEYGNCAYDRHGAWWYYRCTDSNLNGKYSNDTKIEDSNIYWLTFNRLYPLKFVEMKLKLFHV